MTTPLRAAGTIDVGRWDRIRLLLGSLLLLALGGSAVVAAIGNLTTDGSSTGVRVALGVIGVPLLLAGVGLLIWRLRTPPVALLDIGSDGIALRHRNGVAWQVTWDELSSVRLVRARWRMVRTGPSAQLGWQRGVKPEFPCYFLCLQLRGSGGHGRLAVDLGLQRAPARALQRALDLRTEIEILDARDSARVRGDASGI